MPELAPPTHALARTPEEWCDYFEARGEKRFRGKQIFQWIHRDGVFCPEDMSNLSKSVRGELRAEFGDSLMPLAVSYQKRSKDNTRKLLVRMPDEKEVETVLIPQLRDIGEDDDVADEVLPGRVAGERVTQCISSQVGCAMGCVFCASGIAGLKRHMSDGEIVAQVLLGRSVLDEGEHLRNVVFMGMGEPLHNYDAVARTLVLLTHPDGLGLSRRRVTVSTSGLVPQIDRLADDFDGKVALAISLHCVDDDRRSDLMPINRKHPLPELMDCLRRYPMPKRARITIEYTLIRGVNDSAGEANDLVKMLNGIRTKVNLIPMNPVTGSGLGAPDWEAVEAFQARLHAQGLACYIRTQRGDEISAACGQLALHGEERKIKMRLPKARN